MCLEFERRFNLLFSSDKEARTTKVVGYQSSASEKFVRRGRQIEDRSVMLNLHIF